MDVLAVDVIEVVIESALAVLHQHHLAGEAVGVGEERGDEALRHVHVGHAPLIVGEVHFYQDHVIGGDEAVRAGTGIIAVAFIEIYTALPSSLMRASTPAWRGPPRRRARGSPRRRRVRRSPAAVVLVVAAWKTGGSSEAARLAPAACREARPGSRRRSLPDRSRGWWRGAA